MSSTRTIPPLGGPSPGSATRTVPPLGGPSSGSATRTIPPFGEPPSGPQLDAVAALVVALDKAVRGVKLYLGEGSLVERLFTDLEHRAAAALAGGPVSFRLTSFGLVYRGQPVTQEDRRIPYFFKMFCDGVREISLLPGLERGELVDLVYLLGADFRASEEDFVTLLWRRNFPHVRYLAADSFAAMVLQSTSEAAAEVRKERYSDRGRELVVEVEEVHLLSDEGHLSWLPEIRAPVRAEGKAVEVADRVREHLSAPPDMARFVSLGFRQARRRGGRREPGGLVLGALDDFLERGDASRAAALYTAILQGVLQDPEYGEALLRASVGLARLPRLAALLNRQPEPMLPVLETLARHLGQLLVPLLNELRPGPAQALLHRQLLAHGVDLTSYFARQIEDGDEERASRAVRALAGLGNPAAFQALAAALAHTGVPVRRAALEALAERYHPEARIALGRALKDPDRENRLLALRALAGGADVRAARAILPLVQGPGFEARDTEEQAAFLRALASFDHPQVVEYFRSVLSRKNLVRARSVIALQLMAVEALADADQDRARAILARFRDAIYLPRDVREAIEQGLRARSQA